MGSECKTHRNKLTLYQIYQLLQSEIVNVIGWLGAAAVLYAYIMVSTDKVKGDSIHYQAFNIFGALLLIINTAHVGAYPSTVVNIIWVLVAMVSLARVYGKPILQANKLTLRLRPIRRRKRF